MQKQTEHLRMLPEVVDQLVSQRPVCGIAFHGSALRGCARPDSDLDLIILVDEPGEMRIDHDADCKGITLCRTFFPREWLEKALAEEPYIFWPFSQARIIHDPEGIMGRLQAIARSYFERKPEVVAAWRERTEKYRRKKTDPSVEMDGDEWGEFFESLGRKYDLSWPKHGRPRSSE